QVLERPDVASLAADDPPLEVVRRELDDGHGRLCRVTGGDPLQGVRDERSRPPPRVGPSLLLHLADVSGELVADEVLPPLEHLLLRLLRGQPGDPLESQERVVLRLLELVLERLDVHLAVAQPLLAPRELRQLLVDLLFLLEDALLDLDDLDAAVLHLRLDLRPKLDRLLARIDLRLAPDGLGLPLRVPEDPDPLAL